MLNTSKKQLEPHEQILWQHNDVSIELSNNSDATRINASAQLFLSNQRLLFVARPVTYRVIGKGDREFQNLSVQLLPSTKDGGLNQSKLVQPWFGPNKWEAIVIPAKDSTLEPMVPWKIVVSFTNGGAFDFTAKFGSAVSDAMTARREGIAEPLPAYAP